MEFNEGHIEALLKDLTPSSPPPSPWQAEVITIEDDAAPGGPSPLMMTLNRTATYSRRGRGLSRPASLPQEQTFASLGALESYLHDFSVSLGFDVARSK
ncbi:hypothetical protein E4U15_001372 [Claviceps sp. LM218 group G6]|nr:hypothetical protein E4U15_001372 [Claviceps sp. LM218 group G6]